MMSMHLIQIAEAINGELIGDKTCLIQGVSELLSAESGDITFVNEPKYCAMAQQSKASAFVVYRQLDTIQNQIIIKNPRKALAQVLNLFYPPNQSTKYISELAAIAESASIGEGCQIDAYASIEDHTQIGAECIIRSGVRIGSQCKIGVGCVIYPNVVIYDHTEIGDYCIIHAGAVLGGDGFGFYPDGNKWGKVPHIGKVVLGNDVEIGSNTCVDRGCLGNTVIGNGVKIDNFVHIAHNCKIGDNCAMAAFTGISGGVTLGAHVMAAGQVGVQGHVTIGDNATILGRSGITKDVPPNAVMSGYPAQSHSKEMKDQAVLRRLIKKGI